MSKTAEQILTFDAFMADQQLTTIKDGTEIHGDPNKQTVVAFNPIKPFVDIAFKLKPECHGIAFQNVKFICETLFCYLTIRFNILSDYCTFTDCHFDINIKFCPRYNKVVRLDNCKASPAAKLDFFDGSIFINDCDFHLNQVTFSRCSNIHGVKTKFNNMGIYDTGNINVTFRYCNLPIGNGEGGSCRRGSEELSVVGRLIARTDGYIVERLGFYHVAILLLGGDGDIHLVCVGQVGRDDEEVEDDGAVILTCES